MRAVLFRFLFLTFLAVSLFSCKDEPDITKIPDICFNTQVLPVFQTNCAYSGCHDNNFDEGIVLTDYDNILNAGIKPGDTKNSIVYQSVIRNYGLYMPPKNPLSMQQRQIIEVWIIQGAKNVVCTDTTSPPPPLSDKVCFNQDILPILLSNCAITGCHDAITHQSNLNMSNYASLMAGENLVVPFQPDNSKLYTSVLQGNEEFMPPPPKTPLSQQQIDLIRKWITEGATNDNSCGCDTVNVTYTNIISPIIVNSCKGCHSGSTPSGGINLSSYNDVKTQMDNGKLWASINLTTGQPKAMPPGGKLTDCKIKQIRIWKDAGAPNN
jgi:hypothetical protein